MVYSPDELLALTEHGRMYLVRDLVLPSKSNAARVSMESGVSLIYFQQIRLHLSVIILNHPNLN
jgi:hypothetical protein